MMGTTQWGLAIGGAGPTGTIEKFFAEVRANLPTGQFDRVAIETVLENSLIDFKSRYVNTSTDRFSVIVGAYDRLGLERLLYQASAYESSSVVLSPVTEDCHIGMGDELWRFVSDTLYNRKNSVADNVRVAIFATKLAINYSSGVDEPIQVVSYTFGDQFWTVHSRYDIKDLSRELSLEDLKFALLHYWRIHNPPTTLDQVRAYGSIQTPGDELTLLEGVRLEELYTVAGRKRTSRIFHRNMDKIQQCAHSARQQRQAGQSGM